MFVSPQIFAEVLEDSEVAVRHRREGLSFEETRGLFGLSEDRLSPSPGLLVDHEQKNSLLDRCQVPTLSFPECRNERSDIWVVKEMMKAANRYVQECVI